MKTMLKTVRFRTGCFTAASKLDLTAVAAIMFRFDRRDDRDLAMGDLQVVHA